MTRPRTTYGDDIKAAVMAALLTGQSISAVAKEYKVPSGTVSRWRADASEIIKEERAKKTTPIDVLLFEYLQANLTALKKQTDVFSDEEWLKRQDASSVAVLHGVLADKAVRLLEAAGRADESED